MIQRTQPNSLVDVNTGQVWNPRDNSSSKSRLTQETDKEGYRPKPSFRGSKAPRSSREWIAGEGRYKYREEEEE